ncbi:DUF3617 family protein [Erythrobacter arachoides]|uniref:DUF3617 family protein n=1 Tax=Aurantiacibacter arachoides TaxID=1850444 RepID=A0A845A0Z2_9SPHN|nr:DUF3617 domain-containing protein [Aurantiacibacter arachoides]MXO93795.1 DUF3617 family protein [Aurantiacibacter arachoides]GGD46601.1 hypothetical protein GCM10011411_02870 [Aurantiacibacter arachoides]
MRRIIITMASLPLLALAGCGDTGSADADGDGAVSVAEAADRMDDEGMRPQAGRYRVSTEILEFDLPGAPAGAGDMIREQMASGQESEYCLTQADVDEGYEAMARRSQDAGENCSFSRFDASGGNIDAEMICTMPGQGTMTITMDGEGTATSSVMETAMRGSIPGMGDMTMRARATHQRIGDC